MATVSAVVDKYQNEKVALVPYWEGLESPHSENTLPYLYFRTKEDNLFHQSFAGFGKRITLSSFVAYLSVRAVVIGIVKEKNDIAGYGFINESEGEKGHLKANAGYVFFKKYWGTQEIFDLSVYCLRWWFCELGIEILYGSALSTNRLAIKYGKRFGFEEVGRLPKFFVVDGVLRDGVFSALDREKFLANFGVPE